VPPLSLLWCVFSLVGVKPVLISREISANGISGNQHQLLGVPVVGLELLLMRLVLIEKTTFGRFCFRD